MGRPKIPRIPGMCKCRKNPLAPGKKSCVNCLEVFKQRTLAKRNKNKDAGLCYGNCGRVPETGTWCNTCKAGHKTGRDQRVAANMAAGRCRNSADHEPAKEGCTLCQACIDKLSATSSEHYHRRKKEDLCRFGPHAAEPGKSMCTYHKAKYVDYRLKIKLETLEAYGGAWCAECNETDLDMLHLDHVDTDGKKHREDLGGVSGYAFHLKLRAAGYPQTPRLRVLCANHNSKAYADHRRST